MYIVTRKMYLAYTLSKMFIVSHAHSVFTDVHNDASCAIFVVPQAPSEYSACNDVVI